jgi:hypothetical protein
MYKGTKKLCSCPDRVEFKFLEKAILLGAVLEQRDVRCERIFALEVDRSDSFAAPSNARVSSVPSTSKGGVSGALARTASAASVLVEVIAIIRAIKFLYLTKILSWSF